MRLLKNALIIFLMLGAVCSCGKDSESDKGLNGDGSENENPAVGTEKNEEVFLSGQVISVSYNSDRLADFLLLTENGSVCRVTPGAISENAVAVGQNILVTVDGSVLESDPMQAVAKNVDVTEEFNEMPMDIEVYSVYNVVASRISEALTSSGFRFYRFESFAECLDFLEENDLSEELSKTVGDTDISALTDSFFEMNDLGIFVVNSAEDYGNIVENVYYDDDVLYLMLSQTTQNTVLVNTKFDVFLMPLSKENTVSEGIVLIEKYLEPSLAE